MKSRIREDMIHATVEQITCLLLENRRKFLDQDQCNYDHFCDCSISLEKKVKNFIQGYDKIIFILPAFPAKSTNAEKTAGYLPDFGEKLSLYHLNKICNEIKSIYPPGAQIIICSDGRVFNDLLNISDEKVTAYIQDIAHIIKSRQLTNLLTYNLEDFYQKDSYDEMRSDLQQHFGDSIEIIASNIKAHEKDLRLFNGIHRFIYEDLRYTNTLLSKNKLRIASKTIAYQVIQRSNAWSNLISNTFKGAIRLSIHPQMCGSEKFGIMLLQSDNVWVTPWHSVVLQIGNDYRLVKHKVAKALGAKPVFVNERFFTTLYKD
jgi:pyoverdine/dityrosine biosynthesis protein Dit1